jgi:hypothetical protein
MAFWDIKVFRHVFFAGYLVVFGRSKEVKVPLFIGTNVHGFYKIP